MYKQPVIKTLLPKNNDTWIHEMYALGLGALYGNQNEPVL